MCIVQKLYDLLFDKAERNQIGTSIINCKLDP